MIIWGKFSFLLMSRKNKRKKQKKKPNNHKDEDMLKLTYCTFSSIFYLGKNEKNK